MKDPRFVPVVPHGEVDGYEGLFASNHEVTAEPGVLQICYVEFTQKTGVCHNGTFGKWFGEIFVPILAIRLTEDDAFARLGILKFG